VYDGRGSVDAVLSEAAEVVARYKYDAFGNVSGDIAKTAFYAYNGEEFNPISGLQYLRARYYDTSAGRFITEDTYLGELTEPQSLNLYSYTRNNPVNAIDPSGHRQDDAGRATTTTTKTALLDPMTMVALHQTQQAINQQNAAAYASPSRENMTFAEAYALQQAANSRSNAGAGLQQAQAWTNSTYGQMKTLEANLRAEYLRMCSLAAEMEEQEKEKSWWDRLIAELAGIPSNIWQNIKMLFTSDQYVIDSIVKFYNGANDAVNDFADNILLCNPKGFS
jgi:RHS repeat-associated protein